VAPVRARLEGQRRAARPGFVASATQFVREEDVASSVPCGPDVDQHAEAFKRFVEAGFTHVVSHGRRVGDGMRLGNVEVRPLGGGLGCLLMILFSVIASIVLTVLLNLVF
jgi:hypothetical protein